MQKGPGGVLSLFVPIDKSKSVKESEIVAFRKTSAKGDQHGKPVNRQEHQHSLQQPSQHSAMGNCTQRQARHSPAQVQRSKKVPYRARHP